MHTLVQLDRSSTRIRCCRPRFRVAANLTLRSGSINGREPELFPKMSLTRFAIVCPTGRRKSWRHLGGSRGSVGNRRNGRKIIFRACYSCKGVRGLNPISLARTCTARMQHKRDHIQQRPQTTPSISSDYIVCIYICIYIYVCILCIHV